MKKIITAVLIAIMCVAMSISTFAENPIQTSNGNDTVNVKAKYTSTERAEEYKVIITWGSMEFDYTEGAHTWNENTHKWSTEEGIWTLKSGSSADIKLENHSSVPVEARFMFNASDIYTNVTGSFKYDNNSISSVLLEKPAENVAAVTEYIVTFTPSGKLENTVAQDNYNTVVGNITVSLG